MFRGSRWQWFMYSLKFRSRGHYFFGQGAYGGNPPPHAHSWIRYCVQCVVSCPCVQCIMTVWPTIVLSFETKQASMGFLFRTAFVFIKTPLFCLLLLREGGISNYVSTHNMRKSWWIIEKQALSSKVTSSVIIFRRKLVEVCYRMSSKATKVIT